MNVETGSSYTPEAHHSRPWVGRVSDSYSAAVEGSSELPCPGQSQHLLHRGGRRGVRIGNRVWWKMFPHTPKNNVLDWWIELYLHVMPDIQMYMGRKDTIFQHIIIYMYYSNTLQVHANISCLMGTYSTYSTATCTGHGFNHNPTCYWYESHPLRYSTRILKVKPTSQIHEPSKHFHTCNQLAEEYHIHTGERQWVSLYM